MSSEALPLFLFTLFVLGMLAVDLGLFHRKAHVINIKEAVGWSIFWITISLLFNFGVYLFSGTEPAMNFLGGYLLEKALSVDNLFVFLLILTYFRVPAAYQHKVLFWGIIGALLMRALFIATGITLIQKFHWMTYVFGGFLVWTGIKLAFEKDEEIQPEKNPVLKLFRRFMPISENYEESRFFVKKMGRTLATPLFVVLIVVETTDVIFAVDSIPAVLGITTDPFIVYTSNVFAILGLRSLYFALSGLMELFHYLNYGLSIILVFIGVKMLVANYYEIPLVLALGVIAGVLLLSVLASVIWPQKEEKEEEI